MSVIELSTKYLKVHEGYRARVYKCTAGKNTIGYGRNVDDVGVSTVEAEYMLQNDINACLDDLEKKTYWDELTDLQQAGLVNLRFNLGMSRFNQFRKMEAALVTGDYAEAALQVMDSAYGNQVGKRADDVASMLQDIEP